MKFLDVFNEIEKGNYALTDEAIYASHQNGDELVPLYGGNKDHIATERRISISAKTKKGVPITVFSGEGIIISLDGSAGSMTYKNGERFALNHHAGFITLKSDAVGRVNLEYFSIFLQNFYREMGVSDGSKTLSLTQIYAEEFDLPEYDIQCSVLAKVKQTGKVLRCLKQARRAYEELKKREITVEYRKFQAKQVPIKSCIHYISGSSQLTEEKNYQRLKGQGEKYKLLTGSTEKANQYVMVSASDEIGSFSDKYGLLVTRKGKAGHTEFLVPGRYVVNDDAYILYVRDDCKYKIDLLWLSIQYRELFYQYSSSSDNGTWNMTGFFDYARIDIPQYEEQIAMVEKYQLVQKRIESIESIEEKYARLLTKEIA